jgi:hypothetical protein
MSNFNRPNNFNRVDNSNRSDNFNWSNNLNNPKTEFTKFKKILELIQAKKDKMREEEIYFFCRKKKNTR